MTTRSPILVTGAGGFLGQSVCAQLRARGLPVTALIRARPAPDGLPAVRCDLEDDAAWRAAAEGVQPSLVIHLAAPVALSRDPAGWAEMRRGIVDVTDRIARWCLGRSARLLYVSTCEVYGDGPAPFRETQAPRPVSPYSAAKAAAEAWVGCLARTRGLDALIARPFLSYGPGQSRARLIPAAIEAALDRRPFPMTDGQQTREVNFVEDTARGLIAAALSDRGGGEIVNIGGGPEVNVRALVERIYRACGADPSLVQPGALPRRGGETDRFLGDPGRALRWLGHAPAVDLDDGLARTIAARRAERAHSAGGRGC